MATDVKYDGPVMVRLPTLPDLRLEQFFLATIRYCVRIHGNDPEPAPVVEPGKHIVTHTDWASVTSINWCVSAHRRAVISSLINEQLVSPFWQGVFWGIAGVAFAHARQSIELARAAHAAAKATALASLPQQSFIGRLLSRIIVH